ncbi:MAG: hypothetical protein AAGI14_04460 [Pseudomonadota bacterium]
MFRAIIFFWITALTIHPAYATPALFSEEEQSIILAFPTQNGSLDWNEMHSRVESADQSLLSFPDAYIGAIVALRTGHTDDAFDLLAVTKALTNKPESKVLSDHLGAFLNFYSTGQQSKETDTVDLLEAVSNYKENSMQADWLAGTSISILVDTARNNSDPLLLAKTLQTAEQVFKKPRKFETTAWLLSLYIKGGYTAALQANDENRFTASYFLTPALMLINEVETADLKIQEADILKTTYFRIHAIEAAETSRMAMADSSKTTLPLPLLERYHPDFQNQCVKSIKTVSSLIRPREYVGSGGFILELSISEKGRATYKKLVDAQPNLLKQMDTESTLKDLAKKLRVEIDVSNPSCKAGGRIIIPYTLAAQ